MTSENSLMTLEDAFGGDGDLDALLANIEESEANLAEDHGGILDLDGVELMKFAGRHGSEGSTSPWTYGTSNKEVHPDSKWVIEATTFQHGWFGWKPGAGGGIAEEGTLPDQVWAPFFKARPPKPEGCAYMKMAWTFDCICVESPDEEEVGTMVRVTEYRAMAGGFRTMDEKLRERAKEGALLRRSDDPVKVAKGEKMHREMHPVVQFHFELGINVPKYKSSFNKGVLKFTGQWVAAQDVGEAPQVAATTESVEPEVLPPEDAPKKRASRRPRS